MVAEGVEARLTDFALFAGNQRSPGCQYLINVIGITA